MKKLFALFLTLVMCLSLFTACGEPVPDSGTKEDILNTLDTVAGIMDNQPTPTDIDYSLERYNLIKRAYWVNGQREKAMTVLCPIERPLGYIVLLTDNGAVLGKFIVDGKVSSLNSYLTPDSEYYEKNLSYASQYATTVSSSGVERYSNKWLADVDGSYGSNDNGIFFFTPDGKYVEWTGTYMYSDIPFEIENPILKMEVGY